MAVFGAHSEAQLATCHPDLARVMRRAVQYFDFAVVEGFRNQKDQDAAYVRGDSQLKWPHGNHNHSPSFACDVAPFPIDWSASPTAIQRFVYLAGWIMMAAQVEAVGLRWGGDWNKDNDMRDEHFRDYGHFELWPNPI
jgi:peptidoglycan L-alanyl-D-glutamate endopeptidase CwlK